MILDKLPGICGDLVRTDPDWEGWDFNQLSQAGKKKTGWYKDCGEKTGESEAGKPQ